MHYLYILQSVANQRYYIGTAKDPVRRLAQHNGGGTISTKAYRPWTLVHTEDFRTAAEARARERQIKTWKNPAYMVKALGITPVGRASR